MSTFRPGTTAEKFKWKYKEYRPEQSKQRSQLKPGQPRVWRLERNPKTRLKTIESGHEPDGKAVTVKSPQVKDQDVTDLPSQALREPKFALSDLLDSSLDPFCKLPIGLGSIQRSLLHHYLTGLPRITYGVKEGGLFEPIRDVAFASMQQGVISLQWAIIAAEVHIIALRQLPTPPSLLRRRSEVYNAMNNELRDPIRGLSDSLMAGIVMAIIHESRNNADSQIIKTHIQGYEAIIKARGGFKRMFTPVGPALFPSGMHLPYLFCENSMADLQELQRIVGRVVRQLSAMQCWQKHLRLESKNTEVRLLLDTYKLVFSYPLLAKFLTPQFALSSAAYPHRSSHFIVLYSLNFSLWTMREDFAEASEYLKRVLYTLKGSVARDQDGTSILRMEGLMWIVMEAGIKHVIDPPLDDETKGVKLARTVVATIEALKFFGALSASKRTEVAQVLSSWLVGPSITLTHREATDRAASEVATTENSPASRDTETYQELYQHKVKFSEFERKVLLGETPD